MKTKSRTRVFTRILATVLTLMLAFAVAVPALGAENLTITIHNAEGLKAMERGEFHALQIFKGNAYKEGAAGTNPWGATEWNNWTLSDIEWGSAFNQGGGDNFLVWLKNFHGGSAHFPGLVDDTGNVFQDCNTAEEVAEVLVGKPHQFFQGFAMAVLFGSLNGESSKVNKASWINEAAAVASVVDNPEENDTAKQTSSIDVTDQGPGYYLICENFTEHETGEDFESEYIFAVLGSQDIQLKGSLPDVEKQIVESNGDKVSGDVAGVGDVVNFELDGTVADDISDFTTEYNYIFHDTLSKGLTFNPSSVKVSVDTDYPLYTHSFEFNQVYDDYDHNGYKLTPSTSGELKDGQDNEITIEFVDLKTAINGVWEQAVTDGIWLFNPWTKMDTDENLVDFNKHIKIHVTYSATLNDDAILGNAGNPNTVQLEYSNDPNGYGHGESEEKRVYVYTFGLDLTKIGSDTKQGLQGAGFTLKRDSDGKIAKFTTDGNNKQITGWEDPAAFNELYQAYLTAKDDYDKGTESDRKGALREALTDAQNQLSPYVLYSGSDGKIPKVESLDEGTYTLSEVITPDGYNTMDDFTFKIEAVLSFFGLLHGVKYTYPGHDGQNITVEYDENDPGPANEFHLGYMSQILENRKAPFLPFTGGIGRTVFYVAGVLLIGAAVAYIIIAARKRGKAESGK